MPVLEPGTKQYEGVYTSCHVDLITIVPADFLPQTVIPEHAAWFPFDPECLVNMHRRVSPPTQQATHPSPKQPQPSYIHLLISHIACTRASHVSLTDSLRTVSHRSPLLSAASTRVSFVQRGHNGHRGAMAKRGKRGLQVVSTMTPPSFLFGRGLALPHRDPRL